MQLNNIFTEFSDNNFQLGVEGSIADIGSGLQIVDQQSHAKHEKK